MIPSSPGLTPCFANSLAAYPAATPPPRITYLKCFASAMDRSIGTNKTTTRMKKMTANKKKRYLSLFSPLKNEEDEKKKQVNLNRSSNS